MTRLIILSWLAVAAASAAADRVAILPVDCEVSLALSAAPAHLREEAGVFVLTGNGQTRYRESANQFNCIVNRDHPAVLKPTCFDAEGSENIIPTIRFFADRLLAQTPLDDVREELAAAFDSGRFVSARRPGVAYMLSRFNRPWIPSADRLGFFPPHVMFYAPNLTNADIGHDMRFHNPAQPLPMIAYGGPQGYMIMISDDGITRSRGDLHSSCPDWVFDEDGAGHDQ